MNLSVGIVGLPNAGKSTLFNALCSRRLAETAPRPFTTIDPHEAIVSVPDDYLEALSHLIKPEKTVPATIEFIDIAGLVKGAHKGEGLGNQFLGKIREVDAIVHVVRAFPDETIVHQHALYPLGSLEQVMDDIEIVNLELELGNIVRKKTVYVLNISESDINNPKMEDYTNEIKDKFQQEVILISAKIEEELIDFTDDEKRQYLNELQVKETGLEQLIKKAYQLLNLITFYTVKGGKEVHAWSLVEGAKALDAAGVVHTDFAQNFIKAEVINVGELLEMEGWRQAKEKGKVRLEGKDYVVQDKDVIEFKVGGEVG